MQHWFTAVVGASRPLERRHLIALGMLATHALFLMLSPSLIKATADLEGDAKLTLILGVYAMLGSGMIFFFLYSKWISPAKGNALIQAVNVTLGTMLLVSLYAEETLSASQWLGILICAAGILMMISKGDSEFFLFPGEGAEDDDEAGDSRFSPRRTLHLLMLGVGVALALWLASLDYSRLAEGLDAMLSDRANALQLFAFEVAATTLVPLVAKVAVPLRPWLRATVSLTSLAILAVSLAMAFYYVKHLSISETNAVLQTTNTLVGTLLVACLFTDERLSPRQLAGAVVSAAGMLLTLGALSGSFDLYATPG